MKTNRTAKAQQRPFIRPDGSFIIDRIGEKRAPLIDDFYHALMSMRRWQFFLTVFLSYFVINICFALAYFLAGPGAIEGISAESWPERLLGCFFFSIQTFSTIGYGRVAPISTAANLLVGLEAFSNLFIIAVTTGVVFAKVSRPTARVLFSDKASVTTIDGEKALVLRMANDRLNQIMDARVRLTLTREEVTREGVSYRDIYDLKLERDNNTTFALSWLLVHYLTPDSPLYGMTPESLHANGSLFLVSVTGMDDTFNQNVNARHAYWPDDIVWGRHFKDILERTERGSIAIRLNDISTFEDAPSESEKAGQ